MSWEQKRDSGIAKQVAWLPEQFVHYGKVLTIKDTETGKWSDGWVVVTKERGDLVEEPPDYRKMIRSHRNKTGDNLPKKKG